MIQTPNILRAESAILAIGRQVNVSVQPYENKLLWTVTRDLGENYAIGQGDSLPEAIENIRLVTPPALVDLDQIERAAA
jgi:hypothetical protein